MPASAGICLNLGVLKLSNVCKTYSAGGRKSDAGVAQPALSRVDLEVTEGEFLTVLGPSGCGKTTLLRSIAGFETPDSGLIRIGERNVADNGHILVSPSARGIGFVPQEGALFPHLNVAKNVGFGLRHLSRADRRQRVTEVLSVVGLEHLATRRPHEISGGQQQRVALARAIAPGPRVLLLDEPFSSLDAYLRSSLREEVRRIIKELGITAILVTHDQEEALSLGDRVAAMRSGRIVQVSDPRDIYYRPEDLELASFLGEAVVVDGRLDEDPAGAATVSCEFGSLTVNDPTDRVADHGRRPADPRCRVMIRPEQIRVVKSGADDGITAAAGRGTYGVLCDQSFYGHDSRLVFDIPALDARVAIRALGDSGLRKGDRVPLTVDERVGVYSPAGDILSASGTAASGTTAPGTAAPGTTASGTTASDGAALTPTAM